MRCSCCQEELVNNLTLRELFFQVIDAAIIVKNCFLKLIKKRHVQVAVVLTH